MPRGQLIPIRYKMEINAWKRKRALVQKFAAFYKVRLPSFLRVNREMRGFMKRYYHFDHEETLRLGVWMCKDDILSFEDKEAFYLFFKGRDSFGGPRCQLSYPTQSSSASALNYGTPWLNFKEWYFIGWPSIVLLL